MNKMRIFRYNVIPCMWKHHVKNSGWGSISQRLKTEFHDSSSPIDMYTAYEYQVRQKVKRPFVAFFHQVPYGYERSLEQILGSTLWRYNQRHFLGGFVFSQNQKTYMLRKKISGYIRLVYHPTFLKVSKWQMTSFLKNRTLLHIGVHCRNVDFFLEVASRRRARERYVFLAARKRDFANYHLLCDWAGVEIKKRLDDDTYSRALTSSVVFLNLAHAAANNVVLECIARGTPMIINRVGGIKDYLGSDYPLYYTSKAHAVRLIEDINKTPQLLSRTNTYLLRLRSRYSRARFLADVKSGLRIIASTP